MASQERPADSQNPPSQERATDSQIPTTQDVDILTQSTQDPLSQQPTLAVWGRLCPLRVALKNLEMIKDTYSLGRAEDCDLQMTTNEFPMKVLNTVSKVHFRIYKEQIDNMNDVVVYLEDISHNGTFVDHIKVGHGNRVILENNSQIAITKNSFPVYVFINVLMPETNELPLELKQKYALGRKLGAGSCGEVRMIFSRDGTQKFAMKTIKKDNFGTSGSLFDNQIKNEVEILKKLDHPCIIKMANIHDTPMAVYLILELMEGGELLERIRSRGKLTESCAKLIFYQVILAVYYLHRKGITHRDLKPENILLKSHCDKTLVKVSDFGLSKLVDARSNSMKTFCGTPMYVAPEILANLGRSSYTNQVDVWSLGVILYTCLSGMVPFNTKRTDISLEQQIRRGLFSLPQSYFGHLSPNAIDLIKRMMTVNPMRRITISQILFHPWLRDQTMKEEALSLGVDRNYERVMMENDENAPPPNAFENRHHETFENRRRETNLYPESKRPRLNV